MLMQVILSIRSGASLKDLFDDGNGTIFRDLLKIWMVLTIQTPFGYSDGTSDRRWY